MYKYRKIFFIIIVILYLILSLIELIEYFLIDSNLFGTIYLIINLIIIFLLVPTVYNYKNNYSNVRFSKLILILIFGLFNSYLLYPLIVNNMNYIDSSNMYENSIYVIKNILKLFIYFGIIILIIREGRLLKKISFNFKKMLINKK